MFIKYNPLMILRSYAFNVFRFLNIFSFLPMVIWSYGHMVLWSYGLMVLWSYGLMVLWSYGLMVLWSYGFNVFIRLYKKFFDHDDDEDHDYYPSVSDFDLKHHR